MFTNKTPRGGGVRPSKLAKLIKLKRRALALALSLVTAISAFAGLDLTVFADDEPTGSQVSLKITITTEDFPETPKITLNTPSITYTYDVISVLGTLKEKTSTEQTIKLDDNGNGVYTGQGKLNEVVSTREGKDELNISFTYVVNGSHYYATAYVPYTTDTIEITRTVKYTPPAKPVPPPPDAPRVTPDWEKARIYCFDDPETNPVYPKGGASYNTTDGAHRDITTNYVLLYANGGKVENVVGAYDNTKTKQLTLWETFSGVDAGTYDSTNSKQIAWIVTKDDKCPENMKQKSDNSIVKVSKGKITAIAPGDAYVWACRVHPEKPNSVSTTESARVHVHVEDAPKKVILTHEIPDDENATVVPIGKVQLGVGESEKIYIYMESKIETLSYSQWRVEVTKGSEYLGVSHSGISDTFSTKTVRPFRGKQHAYFYVKGLGIQPNGKAATAEVTLTNLYTGKKTKLKVNISNAVVETTQPVRGADDLKGLVVTSQRIPMSYALPHEMLNHYYKTSAQKYLAETDESGNDITPTKYAALVASPTSDKPQIIVSSDLEVTREMIFKDTKSGLQVSFTGTKSKTVTAKWESGFLKMNVKKDAAAEKGNIIIIFNKSHDMNGVLIVPYQVTSADLSVDSTT